MHVNRGRSAVGAPGDVRPTLAFSGRCETPDVDGDHQIRVREVAEKERQHPDERDPACAVGDQHRCAAEGRSSEWRSSPDDPVAGRRRWELDPAPILGGYRVSRCQVRYESSCPPGGAEAEDRHSEDCRDPGPGCDDVTTGELGRFGCGHWVTVSTGTTDERQRRSRG